MIERVRRGRMKHGNGRKALKEKEEERGEGKRKRRRALKL